MTRGLVLASTLLLGALYAQPEKAGGATRHRDDDPAAVFAAVIHRIAASGVAGRSRDEVLTAAIESTLRSIDAYSRHLSAAELREEQRGLDPRWVGIGIELLENREGQWICFPQPRGPAFLAGVRPGDRLLAIDGKSVEKLRLFQIRKLASGPEGTAVNLTIVRGQNGGQRFTVRRKPVGETTVFAHRTSDLLYCRLTRFSVHTDRDLRRAISEAPDARLIVCDLRGNAGGLLDHAVGAAGLFLAKGETVCVVRDRRGDSRLTVSRHGLYRNRELILLQDGTTASAAEVFIAALVDNGRAVSLGTVSFGKGRMQETFPLPDGSAIRLTTGHLLGPKKGRWDGRGLVPTHIVKARDEGAFFRKIEGFVRSRMRDLRTRSLAEGTRVVVGLGPGAVDAPRPHRGEVYVGVVRGVSPQGVEVELRQRLRYAYAPDAPEGVDSRDWFPVPLRRLTLVAMTFEEAAGPHWQGERLQLRGRELHPVIHGVDAVLLDWIEGAGKRRGAKDH